jgi:hypothetical protein
MKHNYDESMERKLFFDCDESSIDSINWKIQSNYNHNCRAHAFVYCPQAFFYFVVLK